MSDPNWEPAFRAFPRMIWESRPSTCRLLPKADGMMMLIKTMAPEVIAVDEIGSGRNFRAIEYARNCGCCLIATVHGTSMEDIREKPVLNRLIRERTFRRYAVLGKNPCPGTITAIYDEGGIQVNERRKTRLGEI